MREPLEIFAEYDSDTKIIRVTPVGDVNKANVVKTIEKAVELSKEHGCFKILFDIRQCPIGQSMIQGFQVMQDLPSSTGISFDYKLAVLRNPELFPEDRARFIENVVDNRPNPTLKMFTDNDEAIGWLR